MPIEEYPGVLDHGLGRCCETREFLEVMVGSMVELLGS